MYKKGGVDKTSEVVLRAGKVASKKGKGKVGKWEHFWNLKDPETGHVTVEDTAELEEISLVPEDLAANNDAEDEDDDDAVYVVIVPRFRHGEVKCKEAKEEELSRFDEFDVYEEVEDEGQTTLGTNWVLTEKVKNDKIIIKARLTIRGDQEEATDQIQSDSPTVRKQNINILLMVAARNKWDIKSDDVTSAFLQSVPIEREIFVNPPRERRIPGVVWRLKKSVYGLVDASRGFYKNFSQSLVDLGCVKARMDPAMFIHFENGEEEVSKEPTGIAVTHVDDVLSVGNTKFDKNVMGEMKKVFKFGNEESLDFKYVGLNMVQYEEGIEVDNNHYVAAMELPNMDLVKQAENDEVMNPDGQTEFRSAVGKLTSLAHTSRPDICFDVKTMASKLGKATKKDLQSAMKKMMKVRTELTSMRFPNLSMNLQDWLLVGFGDAGVKSMPDKITSVGGHVKLLCDVKTNNCCVLGWKSRKIKRKVVSSLAGETLAMIDAIGDLVYTKAVLVQLFGSRANEVKTVVVTDCKNLEEAIKSTSLVDDPWLVPDVAVIKEALENGTITKVKRVRGEDMLANCLTKSGASGKDLLAVLKSGYYKVPEDWK